MTKAEAVRWLKAYAPKNPRKMYGKYLKEATEIAVKALEEQGGNGMHQCFHCGAYAVSWDCDYDFEDMGYDGEGVVNCCHCNNCGAEIVYQVAFNEEQEGQHGEKDKGRTD